MEPKGSLPHSQVPASCPYPELTLFIEKVNGKVIPLQARCGSEDG